MSVSEIRVKRIHVNQGFGVLLCVLAEQAVLGSAKTALKFEYEI